MYPDDRYHFITVTETEAKNTTQKFFIKLEDCFEKVVGDIT